MTPLPATYAALCAFGGNSLAAAPSISQKSPNFVQNALRRNS